MAQRDKARKQYETTCAKHKSLVKRLLNLQSNKPSNSTAAKDLGGVTSPINDSKPSSSKSATTGKPSDKVFNTSDDINEMARKLAKEHPNSCKHLSIQDVTSTKSKNKGETKKKDTAKKKEKKDSTKKKGGGKKDEGKSNKSTTNATATSAAQRQASNRDRIEFSEYIYALEDPDHVNHEAAVRRSIADSLIAAHPTYRPGAADIRPVNVLADWLRQSPHPTCRYGMPFFPIVTHTCN